MCLTTNDPTIKKATKPIFCFKVGNLNENALGGFSNNTVYFPLQVSPEVKMDPLIQYDGRTDVNIGYHSFNIYKDAKDVFYSRRDIGIFVIPLGVEYIDGYLGNGKRKNRVSAQIMYICPATFWNRLKVKLGILKIK